MTSPADIEKQIQHRAAIREELFKRINALTAQVDYQDKQLSTAALIVSKLRSHNHALKVTVVILTILIVVSLAMIFFLMLDFTPAHAAPLPEPVSTVVCKTADTPCSGGLFMPRQYLPYVEVRH